MGYDYKTLLDIQEIDIKLLALQKELETIPEEVERLERTNNSEKKAVEDVKKCIKNLMLRRRDLEKEVESKSEHLKKLKNQQSMVKDNESYSAMQKEISADRGNIARMEDEIIEIMEKSEQQEKELKQREHQLVLKDEEIKKKKKEAEDRLRQLKEDIEKSRMQKGYLSKEVDPSLLSLYEKIFENKKDFAIVPIIDNKVCGGCRMSLTANMRNEARKDKIIRCDNCSRILYFS